MWRRISGIFVGLLLGAGTFACSSDDSRDGRFRHYDARDAHAADVRVTGRDAEAESGSDADADAGAQCCPISPAPECCMDYGGSRLIRSCRRFCDGMPWPSPLWRIEHDEYGCPYWVEPETSTGCCGCLSPEAGD